MLLIWVEVLWICLTFVKELMNFRQDELCTFMEGVVVIDETGIDIFLKLMVD